MIVGRAFVLLLMMLFTSTAYGGVHSLVDAVFGVRERTPYCAFDKAAGVFTVGFWMQDVVVPIAEGRRYIIRYTTVDKNHHQFNEVSGAMSVYEEVGEYVYVVAEYSIRADENGSPVIVGGIQQYFPKAVFGKYGESVHETVGVFGHCGVVSGSTSCSPEVVPHSRYRYVVSVSQEGANRFVVNESYWQSPANAFYLRVLEYVDGYLVRAHDFPSDTTYYRYKKVADNGVCVIR